MELDGQIGLVVLAQLRPGAKENARFGQLGNDLLAQHPVDPLVHLLNPDADCTQLRSRIHAAQGLSADIRRHLLQDAGDADLEELVQIGGEDRQELDPLEQGGCGVLGDVQHP